MPPHPDAAPSRVLIDRVTPEIDAGRFPIKRCVGEEVRVAADIFADGHDVLDGAVQFRHQGEDRWREVRLESKANDAWVARFTVDQSGWYEYTVLAWIDTFATWRRDLSKKVGASQDVTSELLEGAALVRSLGQRAGGRDGEWLASRAKELDTGPTAGRIEAALDPALAGMAARHADRSRGTQYGRVLRVWVDRAKARFSAWYELFPRSCSDQPGRHGTFRDVESRLGYVAEMGFDVLYLPPIHPIGRAFRKGPNNTLSAGENDPGSPWAIGGPEGGHKAIHPELGTLDDFQRLRRAAEARGIELALDIAFQCSPDHPWVKEHPGWFRHRPDGTIKYAENPPKKYQDIYPLDFECDDWQGLWNELLSVVLYWAAQGVRIFRVDNPHTKPFAFWEWLIDQVHEQYTDAIFLSEAFTRPKPMKYLAKSGFTQSYSYFTWRNNKWELTEFFEGLTQSEVREYLRPNLFANTPDILPEYLQHGGQAAHTIRLVLAATLGASYGIYGPPYEHFEAVPRPGSEEYLHSEKYELRHWDWNRPNVFCEFIRLVNRIRRENVALQYDHRLRFHPSDNEQILFYSKTSPDLTNIVLAAVNLDPHHLQSGYVRVPLEELGLSHHDSYQVQDLLTEAHFLWQGDWNYVSLDPHSAPAHILRLRKRTRTERDFDYFL